MGLVQKEIVVSCLVALVLYMLIAYAFELVLVSSFGGAVAMMSPFVPYRHGGCAAGNCSRPIY